MPGRFPTSAVTNLAVLANELITNALKYGGPRPDGVIEVSVTLERADGELRLRVWNSGNPVPEGFSAQAGLGLNLVREIAARYGGSFTLRPHEGGTRAEVVVNERAMDE